jgi:hypothetical protein
VDCIHICTTRLSKAALVHLRTAPSTCERKPGNLHLRGGLHHNNDRMCPAEQTAAGPPRTRSTIERRPNHQPSGFGFMTMPCVVGKRRLEPTGTADSRPAGHLLCASSARDMIGSPRCQLSTPILPAREPARTEHRPNGERRGVRAAKFNSTKLCRFLLQWHDNHRPERNHADQIEAHYGTRRPSFRLARTAIRSVTNALAALMVPHVPSGASIHLRGTSNQLRN